MVINQYSLLLAPLEKTITVKEKEIVALVLGLPRFRKYLLRRKYPSITDHGPLINYDKKVSFVATTRIFRDGLSPYRHVPIILCIVRNYNGEMLMPALDCY